MEPGVPFALLGAVELLTVAAWIVLAVAGIGLSRGAVVARVLAPLVTGALLLAAVAAGTGLLLGTASSNVLTLLRAAGLIGVGVGLYAGALGARRDRPLPDGVGVVVPLAAGAAPSLVVGVAGLAAALAGLRARRDAVGVCLAVGIALSGAAGFAATSGTTAPVRLLLRQSVSAGPPTCWCTASASTTAMPRTSATWAVSASPCSPGARCGSWPRTARPTSAASC